MRPCLKRNCIYNLLKNCIGVEYQKCIKNNFSNFKDNGLPKVTESEKDMLDIKSYETLLNKTN